jgi:hypothetical protein
MSGCPDRMQRSSWIEIIGTHLAKVVEKAALMQEVHA